MALNFYNYCPRTSVDFEGGRFAPQDDYDQGDVYTFAFAPEPDLCAVGGSNGMIKLFRHTFDEKLQASVEQLHVFSTPELLDVPMPCTSVVFRPRSYLGSFVADGSLTKDLFFLASYADGALRQFSARTGACVWTSDSESSNHIFSVAYRDDGATLATAGKDAIVRVLDEGSKQVVVSLQGHSNRVFAVQHVQRDLLISAGWDSTVRLWDVRAGVCTQQVYGFSVTSSHSVAAHPDKPLVAIAPSRAGQSVAVLDVSMLGETLMEIPTDSKATPYSVAFSADGSEVLVGYSGSSQVSVVPLNKATPTCYLTSAESTVYAIQCSSDGRWLGLSGKGKVLQLLCTSAK